MNNTDNIIQFDSVANDINDVINNNIIYHFKKELDHTYDADKKDIIKKILKSFSKDKEEFNTKEINKNKLDNFLDKMTHNKFKQTWARLNYEQKITKFEEFVNNYNFDSKVNKKHIVKKLKSILDGDKLVTAKEIIYDKENCKIISIKDFNQIIKNI
jgi:hypothetical protein